jgi:hypothetical protein
MWFHSIQPNALNKILYTMKKSIFIALISASLIFGACSNTVPAGSEIESKTTAKQVYTCPMHPEVQTGKPGDCPKCGMALEKLQAADSTQMQIQADTTHM